MGLLQKYVIDPIIHGGGYNPVNTVFWALGFVLFTMAAFEITKKLVDVRAFRRLFFPWVLVGGLIRPLVDVNVIPRSLWVVTPGIYVTVLSACFGSIALGRLFGKSESVAKIMGWIAVLGLASMFPPLNFTTLVEIFELCFVAVLSVVGLTKLAGQDWLSGGYNLAIWTAHLFEAAATSIGLGVGLIEQHVVAGAVIAFAGNDSILLLKIGVLPLVLWLMRDLEEDVRVFTQTFVFALGAGPGLRDALLAALVS